ncbi:hypothetical protein C8R47DRAFT_178672, partial [Mycena vitilis]
LALCWLCAARPCRGPAGQQRIARQQGRINAIGMARGNSGRSQLGCWEALLRRWLTSGTAFFSWSQPPSSKKSSLQTTMPSLNHPNLVYGFVIGVFCLCVAAVPSVQEGHTSFAAVFLVALIAVNLGVLNVVLSRLSQAETKQMLIINLAIILAALVAALRHALLPALVLVNVGGLSLLAVSIPRVRQTVQVCDHVHGPGTLVLYEGFPRRPQEDLFVTIVPVLAGKIQLLIQATSFCPAALALLDTEHSAVEPAQFAPGIEDVEASLLQVIFVVLAVLAADLVMILSNVALCVLLMSASAYSNVQNVLVGILIRHRSWCSSNDPHNDDLDATIVDDIQNPDNDMQLVRVDTLSPPPPPFPAQLSALRAGAPDLILSFVNPVLALEPAPSNVNEDAASSDLLAIAHGPYLDSSAPGSIPFRRPTSAPCAPNVRRLASTGNAKKKEWVPIRALSFQWARGGCPILITAPPALNGSAPELVPPAATVIPVVDEVTAAVEVKIENTKNDWQPTRALSFQWARGGCPTRIAAPATPTPLNGAAPDFVFKPCAVSAPVIPITDEARTENSEKQWEPTRALSFQWARGGCPIRISAPPAPTLDGSASDFVPKLRAVSAPVILMAVEAKIENTKNDWRPTRALSFQWARGGCPTRITAPAAPNPLNVSAPEFVPPPRAAAASMVPIVDEDAYRPGLSESMWARSALEI